MSPHLLGNSTAHLRAELRSPAERLIAVLSHPEVQRQLPITSLMDLIGTAFPVALDEDFSDEELEKLARWREEMRQREADGG